MKRKLDDSYRLLIPKEIRDALELNKYDELEMIVEDNKIILTKIKNEPDNDMMHLDSQMVSVQNIPYEQLDEDNKSKLQELIESMPYGTKYWDNGILKTKIEDSTQKDTVNIENKEDSIQMCPQCNGVVEPDRKLMVNGKIICKSCSDNLRNQLKQDAAYYKRVKDLYSSNRY